MSKTVCNVINSFLNAASGGGLPEDPMNPGGKKLPAVNNPDILALYTPNMEVQVNVSPVGAEPVEGKRNTWNKNGNDFWHIRVPKNAMSEPTWHDYTLKWSMSHHAEAIGMTGWDWVDKVSRWVAFDFDAITGHAPGVGVTDEKLQAIRDAAINIPWVHTRKSTRGLGFHMYVFFDGEGIPCENHTIHQGLARCILSKMSQEAGFNFATAIDTCGSNMWVWHLDATSQNEGYTLVRENTKTVSLSDLPVNWRDHIDVVTRKRTKIKIGSLSKSDTEDFDVLTSSRNIIPLDDTHREIMSRLGEDTGCTTIWVPEYNLLQTHTSGLAQLKEDHPDIYDGFFETNSPGDDLGEPNCLAGDTKVITRQGVKPISELAGNHVEIMTSRGKWTVVPFRSYGSQNVFNVKIRNRNSEKVIKATSNHRWFVYKYSGQRLSKRVNFGCRKELTTAELETDQILIQTKPQLSVTPSIVGIQHGLVWGDGSCGGDRITSELPLWGEKDSELLKYFHGHPTRSIERSIGATEVWNLPKHFKSLVPLGYDKPYLYGWLAGYFAADGHVSKDGSCILISTNKEAISHVRQVCHILGIETSEIRTYKSGQGSFKPGTNMYKILLKAEDLTADFFLLQNHRDNFKLANHRRNSYWRVVSIEPAGAEEVFCCTVPDTGCFILEDFILTGNCFAFPISDGGWKVYRFGMGHKEHESWTQDGRGWTCTHFNCRPNLEMVSLAMGGAEVSTGFQFTSLEKAAKAAKELGADLSQVDHWMKDSRQTELQCVKGSGRLKVRIDKHSGDNNPGLGWVEKSKHWERIYKVECNPREMASSEYPEFDNLFRATVTAAGSHYGWAVWDTAQEEWDMHRP